MNPKFGVVPPPHYYGDCYYCELLVPASAHRKTVCDWLSEKHADITSTEDVNGMGYWTILFFTENLRLVKTLQDRCEAISTRYVPPKVGENLGELIEEDKDEIVEFYCEFLNSSVPYDVRMDKWRQELSEEDTYARSRTKDFYTDLNQDLDQAIEELLSDF